MRFHSTIRPVIIGGTALILVVVGAAIPASAAGTAVSAPSTTVTSGVGSTQAVSGFSISGTTSPTVTVEIQTGVGTVDLPATSGVTAVDTSNSSDVSFVGSEADLNAALQGLTFTRTGGQSGSISVSVYGANQFRCASTGHVYETVSGTYSWDTALADSAAMFNGHGYLATVTSASENSCVHAGLSTYTGDGRNAWIGARLVPGGQVTEWEWASGPETGTVFWTGGRSGAEAPGQYADWDRVDIQPQDDLGQACGQYYNGGTVLPTWHDNGCGAGNKYVTEVDSAYVVPAVASVTVAAIPAAPAPAPLSSTGVGSASQSAQATIPTGGSVTLIGVGGLATNRVAIVGQGIYTLDPASGLITFAPEVGFIGAATPVTFELADSFGQTGTSTYTATVTAAIPPPVITTSSLADPTVGTPYRQSVSATGAGSRLYTVSAGNLPAGLSLDANTGVISGTPTVPGPVTFSVTVTDAGGSATQSFTLTTLAAATEIRPDAAVLAYSGSDAREPLAVGGGLAILGILVLAGTSFLGRRRSRI